MKKYIFPLIVLVTVFTSCNPDDSGFESVDLESIDSVYNVVSGETTVVAGTNFDFSVKNRQGSSYEFLVTGYNATFANNETYPFIGTGTFEYFDFGDPVEATVEVKETTSWGITETFTYDIVVQPYSNDFLAEEMYSGTTQYLRLENLFGGSSYRWSMTGADNATLSSTDSTVAVLTTIPKETDDVVTVNIVETTATGANNEYSFEIDVLAYCAYDNNALDETVFGTTEYDLSYGSEGSIGNFGGDITSVASFIFDGKSTISANDLSVNWMVDFWGETIDAQNVVAISVDELGLILTIEEQEYMNTTYNGDPYTYNIVGSGLIDGCAGTFTLEWSLCYDDGSACYPFRIEGELPEE